MLLALLTLAALAAPPQERPTRGHLASNPYEQVDYTAYTLEWGEYRIGLGSVSVGILPRTHIGTSPVLDALGVPNLSLKANPLRIGPLDVAALGSFYLLNQDSVSGWVASAGGRTSLQLAEPWSVHLGGRYFQAHAQGFPDLSKFTPVTRYVQGLEEIGIDWSSLDDAVLDGELVHLEAATDVRFNRRDSLILQVGWYAWGRAKSDLGSDLPAILGLPREAGFGGAIPFKDGYTVSLSWQISWRNLGIRMGGGRSAVPGSWAPQAFDIAWRAGGPTKREEARDLRAWRRGEPLPSRVVEAADVPEDEVAEGPAVAAPLWSEPAPPPAVVVRRVEAPPQTVVVPRAQPESDDQATAWGVE